MSVILLKFPAGRMPDESSKEKDKKLNETISECVVALSQSCVSWNNTVISRQKHGAWEIL